MTARAHNSGECPRFGGCCPGRLYETKGPRPAESVVRNAQRRQASRIAWWRCNLIKDVCIFIYTSVQFNQHINHACSRALRLLALLIRTVNHCLGYESAVMLYRNLDQQLLLFGLPTTLKRLTNSSHCRDSSLDSSGTMLVMTTLMFPLIVFQGCMDYMPLSAKERWLT